MVTFPPLPMRNSTSAWFLWGPQQKNKVVYISGLFGSEAFCQALAKDEHVLFNPSEMYGAEHYVRINLATSREVLAEALNRLKDFI